MDDQFNPVFKVSEFNEVINNHLSLLGEVTVEGELSRFDIKNNRLIFGSIKDKTSAVDIFTMPYLVKNYREFEPGMLVRVTGSAGLYKQSSKFRLYVTRMVPQGEGALQLAFEKLKARLESEGLFAPERKRPLPAWPTNIGLITAKDSSAYFDVVKILSARMRGLNIRLLPVNVQGRDAVGSILKAYAYINSHAADFDVVIMARGGGSLEDLQAFNTEELARAVYSCKVPVVSAVGHEDNWSLTDYVADMRASTPSNAAELTVKDKAEVYATVQSWVQFMNLMLSRQLERRRLLVSDSLLRMKRSMLLVDQKVLLLSSRLERAKTTYLHRLDLTNQHIDQLVRLIKSLDYKQTLQRGYSITKNQQGKIMTSPADATEKIITQLAQGVIESYVR